MKNTVLLLSVILLLLAQPCVAIFEGTANADIFIKIYKKHGDYGRLALWHETAAECLTLISVPMNQILYDYYKRHGYEKQAARTEKEAVEIQEQRKFHLTSAKAAWKKSKTSKIVLKSERQKIVKYMTTWLPHYPDRFFDFGIYATFFKEQQERAEQGKDYAKILQIEADAVEMCATLYEKIPIKYGLKSYEKLRNAYLRHATLLRTLANRKPKTFPTQINMTKQIKQQIPKPKLVTHRRSDQILKIAKTNLRVKSALDSQQGVREYAWFQGFAWTASFYNHGWGNLAIAIIDDKTGKIIDVLIDEPETN